MIVQCYCYFALGIQELNLHQKNLLFVKRKDTMIFKILIKLTSFHSLYCMYNNIHQNSKAKLVKMLSDDNNSLNQDSSDAIDVVQSPEGFFFHHDERNKFFGFF